LSGEDEEEEEVGEEEEEEEDWWLLEKYLRQRLYIYIRELE
jgi:hypothetical protein